MLSMQMFGLNSPSRCWLYQIHPCFIEYILSLSMPGLGFQSPCRCLVNTFTRRLHNSSFFIRFHICYTLTFQAGCRFSVLMQMFDYTLQADVGFSISLIYFSYLFLLSMQMFSLHSPSKCWPFQKLHSPLGHILFLDAYNLLCTSPISRVEFHRFYKMLN